MTNLLDPAVLTRIADLELVARSVVDGFVAGLHRSPRLGVSTDFAEHRAYAPGDDVRRVDWKLYARTDRYYVKEFEAETNADVRVMLDVSRSMGYGSEGRPTKLDYARILAASLLYFSQRQRDRVALATYDDTVVDQVPASARHLPAALHALSRARAGRHGSLATPAAMLAESWRRRGITVLVSDLYEEPEAIVGALERLRGAGGDVIVFHLLDPAELEFGFDATASFQDMEGDETLPVVPSALRDRYRALVRDHVAELGRRLAAAGMEYVMVDTSRPLDVVLFDYLAARERLVATR
ncbi:MAG TPA: DUF58 domain-containing protein [Gemmatimonadaceae bacterium]|nr:DUF58 domain-containing protein [Gemmatimonadaceae bacterium]